MLSATGKKDGAVERALRREERPSGSPKHWQTRGSFVWPTHTQKKVTEQDKTIRGQVLG